MIKIVCVPIVVFMAALLFYGCGQTAREAERDGEVEMAKELNLTGEQNTKITDLNERLKNIDSTAEADGMFTDLLNAVSVSFQDDGSTLSAMADKGNVDTIISKLAAKEISLRNRGVSALSADGESGLISADKIAETIENISDTQVSTPEIVEKIKEGQQELRELLPNISPGGSENMTPLEATMVSYALYASGSGQTAPEDISINIPKEKAIAFLDGITD